MAEETVTTPMQGAAEKEIAIKMIPDTHLRVDDSRKETSKRCFHQAIMVSAVVTFIGLIGMAMSFGFFTAWASQPRNTFSQELRPNVLGCEVPTIVKVRGDPLHGTLMVNDKSKGVTWLLDLETGTFNAVELPLVHGNHETAVSPDGLQIAVPHYEDVTARGQGEGGGQPASELSVIDLKTGRATVMRSQPNPLGTPAPHDVDYLPDGTFLATAQLSNAIIRYSPEGVATPILFNGSACNTPHLVRVIPGLRLAVSGCRCTNPGCAGNGSLVAFDVDTADYVTFPMGPRAEGVTVTGEGDVWIGSQTEAGYAAVFSFDGRERTLQNLRRATTQPVPFPLRLEWNRESDTVAVASINLDGVLSGTPKPGETALRLYRASTRELLLTKNIVSTRRGPVYMQGLRAFSSGGRGTL